MYRKDFTLTQGDVIEIKGQHDRIRLLFPQVSINFQNTDSESSLWVVIDGPSEEICEKCKVILFFINNAFVGHYFTISLFICYPYLLYIAS